jgi:hypothetical protein
MAEGNQTVDQLISFTAVENSQSPSSIFNRPYKATLYYTRYTGIPYNPQGQATVE